jgi:hypothetical protein
MGHRSVLVIRYQCLVAFPVMDRVLASPRLLIRTLMLPPAIACIDSVTLQTSPPEE